jgi:hypothetical protein
MIILIEPSDEPVGWHRYTYICFLIGIWGLRFISHIIFNTDTNNPSTTTVFTIRFLVRKSTGKYAHLTIEDASCR